MVVIAVQTQFPSRYREVGSRKFNGWPTSLTMPSTSASSNSLSSNTCTPPPVATEISLHPYFHSYSDDSSNKIKQSINRSKSINSAISKSSSNVKQRQCYDTAPVPNTVTKPAATPVDENHRYNNNLLFCEDHALETAAVQELSSRLLDELRAAKRRHLTCTEVSLPCDLIPRIAAEILHVSAKEPCGLRGCTIYIEFEDEPNNSRRIASLKMDPETVSTFEVYLMLRQDHRSWTALLPQFMKSLARTITISPEFSVTKNKLYAAEQQRSRSSSISYRQSQRAPLATATS